MRFFTPKEAEKTLPLVRKIVSDIHDTGNDIRDLALEKGDLLDESPEIEVLKNRLSDYIDELTEIGCQYKDWNFEIGLVDFPAIIDGRQVYLCWKSDESKLEYYHGMNAGFAGRRKIPEKYFGD